MSKRICIVINSLVQGGAQKSAILLAKELQSMGNKVTILTFYPEETDFFSIPNEIEVRRFIYPFQDKGRVQGNRLWVRIQRVFYRTKDFIDLRACFSAFQPDLVISFEAATSILAYFAKKKSCPLIISERIHPEYHPIPNWAQKLRPYVYKSKNTFLHCQGKQIAAWMEKEFQKNAFVIPNFLGSEVEEVWRSNSTKIKIFSRYSPQKGIDLAISAWRLLPASIRSNYSLEVYGDGDKSEYQKMLDSYDLNMSIKLLGPTKNVKDELRDCLIFLMPSRFEGFPNALTEAMNLGIPCLVTDCPSAIRDITQEGNLARLSQLTPEEISRNLLELLTSQTLLSGLSKAGQNVSQIFNDSNTILDWLDLINWVLSDQTAVVLNCKVCSHLLKESSIIGYRTQHRLIRELKSDWDIDISETEVGGESIIAAFKCATCKSVSFSGRQGSNAFYDACYRSPSYSRTDAWDYTSAVSELSAQTTKMSVLDFGGGISPLIALRNNDTQITVIDLSVTVQNELRKSGVRCFASLSDLPVGEKFNFIMFSHTIEHIDEPIETLSNLIDLLEIDGKIIVTTPDSENIELLNSPLAWPPHHVVALNPSALLKQMTALGLQALQIRRNDVIQNSKFDFMCVGVKRQ